MKKKSLWSPTLLLLPLLLLGCQGSNLEQLNSFIENQGNIQGAAGIVGGKYVSPREELSRYTFDMEIISGLSSPTGSEISYCTVSALSSRILISAAHCIPKDEADAEYKVTAFNSSGMPREIYVEKVLVHEEYKTKGMDYDLVLLKLEKDLPEGSKFVTLPNKDKGYQLTEITSAGYGVTHGVQSANGSRGSLKTASIPVRVFVPHEKVIEMDNSQGNALCGGDSGGPGFKETGDGKYTLVGVASSVIFHMKEGVPVKDLDMCNFQAQYINVLPFLDWIQSTHKKLQAE